jgi:AcrR family transcriptional regulator
MGQKHETKAVRRVQIMEAAGKLIVKRGSEHLTVKSIASEVNISEAAIYRHFKNKKDILFLLADHIGDNLVSDIEEIASEQAASIDALNQVLKSHIAAIDRRRGTSFQVIAEIISFGDKDLNAKAFETVTKYTSSLQKLLEDAAKRDTLKEGVDIKATATLISSVIQGLVNTWVLSNYALDLKKEFADMWSIVSHGILKPVKV